MKLPQLTLRDLFWLVLVLGMALGWWLDRGMLAGQLSKERMDNVIFVPIAIDR